MNETTNEWGELNVERSDNGDKLNGDELFDGLHGAVEALHDEQPGNASMEIIVEVVQTIGECAELLFNARNKLRAANGLPPIVVGE